MKKDNYNYGIDVLKIIATFMMIVMHIMLQGGILANTQVGSANYYVTWVLESICFVSVDLYGLISGYLNARKEVKRRTFIKRWLQVFFYVFLFTAIFSVTSGVVTSRDWLKAFMPILSSQYWYFTQYFVLFMLMPYLNKMIKNLNESDYKKLILTVMIVFSILPFLSETDVFWTNDGYSCLWLIVLYLIGGYFSYYKDSFKLSKKMVLGGIFLALGMTAFSKFFMDSYRNIEFNNVGALYFLNYTSLPILLASIGMLMLARAAKIERGRKIIKFLGKVTFGVYLFHVNIFVWNYVLFDLCTFMANWSTGLLIVGLFGMALGVFALATIVEFLRMKIFEVARIDKLGDWVGIKVGKVMNYIANKV